MRGALSLRFAVGLVFWMACSARVAIAQDQRNLDTHRFTPSLDAQGFLGVPGSATPGPFRPVFGLFLDYAYAPYTPEYVVPAIAGARPYGAVVDHRVTGSVSAELGLGSRTAVGVLVPVALFQSGELPDDARAGELAPIALADPLIAARYRLLGVANEDPLMPKDGPGLGVELRARLPLGADSAYIGEGTTRLGARLLFDMQLLGAGIGGMVGYEYRIHERQVGSRDLEGELQLGVGAKMPLPSLNPLSAVGELRAALDFESEETSTFEGELGLRASFGELTITLAGGGAFLGVLGAPDARVIAGLWYAPQSSDSDRDGVDDDADKCAMLAEDPDGFQDDDGCPDPDNDNDLVPDIDDLCPNVEALEGQDEDEDGCTDAAPPSS